jgi:hypothetical protein
LTGITEEQILLWRERHDAATRLKPEIEELKARKKVADDDIKDVWKTIVGREKPRGEPGKPETAKKWLKTTLKRMDIDAGSFEGFEAFAQKYIDYVIVSKELSAKLPAYSAVSTRWLKDKWGGNTTFYVGQEKAELIAELNIDPKVLYETANKSLKSIVGQLVQIQQDYRDTVREMHSYLSTLSNATAEGFKREVAEFDKSVQDNTNGTKGCDPDFLK